MAERRKAPAYQWYPKDADTDETYKLMTYEQQGIYRALLDHQWLEGSIPAEPTQIARLLPKITPTRFLKLWSGIAPCFLPIEDGTRIANVKLEQQRDALAVYIATQKINGVKGADRRWAGDRSRRREPDRVAIDSLMANDSSASATATASPRESIERSLPPAPTARSNRLMFKGQRFVVFDWMVEDLRRLLGDHADPFELDAWFYALDAEAVKAKIIVPQRDSGKWLQDRTLEEAVRRGLPIVLTQTPKDLKRAASGAALDDWARS